MEFAGVPFAGVSVPSFKCVECGRAIAKEKDLVATLWLLPPRTNAYHASCYVDLLKKKISFVGATPVNSKAATLTAGTAGAASIVVASAAWLLKQPILSAILLFIGFAMAFGRYHVYAKFEKPWKK